MAAFSVVDLLVALGVAATFSAVAVPSMRASVDEMRVSAAARHVVARLQQARAQAVMGGRSTAVRFTSGVGGYSMTGYEDGNGNGVLASDIADGIDRVVSVAERLRDPFPGVDFGARPAVPGVEGSAPPGADPIRLGSANAVTFTPDGTASAGSVYIGARDVQYVVRIYGETGRTRVMRFYPSTGQWAVP